MVKFQNWKGDSINCRTLIILDEAQDLDKEYGNALEKIMKETNVSLSI